MRRYERILSADGTFIHATAEVSKAASVGAGTKVWSQAQIREEAVVGRDCIIGKGVYIDRGVHIGDRCKLQNSVLVFHGFNLADGVFLGPGAMLLNDKNPRAINPDGSLKSEADWIVSRGLVDYGAAVGGGAIVLPGVNIGRMAVVGSGAVVTRDVPPRGIVFGNPARLRGFACDCGHQLTESGRGETSVHMKCMTCGRTADIPAEVYDLLKLQAVR